MAEQPQEVFNRGCEDFKKGNYAAAAESFSLALGTGPAALQSKAAYNLANTLARRGATLEKKEEKITEWKNALQHYDRVLQLEPGNADALHNRDIVQKAIDDLQKEEKKQDEEKKPDPEKKDEEKQDKKDEQEKKEGSQSGEDKKDPQSKDGEKQEGKEKGEKEQSQGTEKKDEQGKQDGKKQEQEQKDGQQKDDAGKQGESKEGQKEDGQQKPGESKNGAPKPGEKKDQPPQPQPGENQPPKKGELKANNQAPGSPGGEPGNSDAAEEAAAAAEGRMTEKQAKTLLDAIKDEKVRLLDPRQIDRQRQPRGFKNW